jgi:hypothetical protein
MQQVKKVEGIVITHNIGKNELKKLKKRNFNFSKSLILTFIKGAICFVVFAFLILVVSSNLFGFDKLNFPNFFKNKLIQLITLSFGFLFIMSFIFRKEIFKFLDKKVNTKQIEVLQSFKSINKQQEIFEKTGEHIGDSEAREKIKLNLKLPKFNTVLKHFITLLFFASVAFLVLSFWMIVMMN